MGNVLMLSERTTSSYEEIYTNVVKRRCLTYRGKEFTYVGQGASRKVYRYGDIVVKLARNGFGILQNKAEIELYTSVDDDLKSIICPILWNSEDCSMLICKYAEPCYKSNGHRCGQDTYDSIMDDEYKSRYNITLVERKINDLLVLYKLDREDARKLSSWGMLNGMPVLVDYGYNRDVRSSCDFHYEYSKKVVDL